MRLRIVAGRLGGRYLNIPKNAEQFRPTKERVRQSVAETIKAMIPHAIVVDLCAGSGAMGLEMASRGAEAVHFVERDRQRSACITKHIELFGINDCCSVFTMDVRKFLTHCRQTYDIVFFDPPYEDTGIAAIVSLLLPLVSAQGVLIYERKISGFMAPDSFPQDVFDRETREYGDTAVEFITRKPAS